MRIFAISDLHVDYQENKKWLFNLSQADYINDLLILAGDVTDLLDDKIRVFTHLKKIFQHVMYVPGNHDLWVGRCHSETSLHKFKIIKQLAADHDIGMAPLHLAGLSIIPLFCWYDYTFGMPSAELYLRWADFSACQWPEGFNDIDINHYFLSINEKSLEISNRFTITYSHFLPRPDLIPRFVPFSVKNLLPVMGTTLLEKQIRKLNSNIHIYGHSHLNRRVELSNTVYINNAFGYPREWRITAKELVCVHEIKEFL